VVVVGVERGIGKVAHVPSLPAWSTRTLGRVHGPDLNSLVDLDWSSIDAHRRGGLGTVYLGFPDESFPAAHPRQWLGNYALGAVAYDLFPDDSPIRKL